MCFLSSLHGISDGLTDDSKFYLALLGQVRTVSHKCTTDQTLFLGLDVQNMIDN